MANGLNSMTNLKNHDINVVRIRSVLMSTGNSGYPPVLSRFWEVPKTWAMPCINIVLFDIGCHM